MLKIENLSQKWAKQNNPTLNGIDLEVATGSIVAIMGKSGCGKSTLLKSIAKTVPSNGHVLLNDKKIRRPGNGIVALFQNSALFEWMTVEENLNTASMFAGTAINPDAIINLLHDLDLAAQTKQKYPHQLSGGMLQRAAIARALAAKPQILLMDEPFSSLDLLTREKVYRTVARFLKERAVSALIVTHHAEEAVFMADKIVFLEGNPSSIKHSIDCSNTVSPDYSTRLKPGYFEKVELVKSYLENLK